MLHALPMNGEATSYRAFLGGELLRRIRINPHYSQRSFAKQLGLSPGELSEVLRGKRRLSLKSTLRVATGLNLNPEETRRFVMLVQVEKTKDLDGKDWSSLLESKTENAEVTQVSLDTFCVISDWYHFGILSLAECEGFRWDPDWISRRLGITAAEVRLALSRLHRVGLIKQRNGRYAVSGENLSSPENVSSEAIRNYHQQILRLATKALENQGVDEREISGISVAVAKHSLPQFKLDVSRFLDLMGHKYGRSRKKQEVYQLEIALFRLSQEVVS